MRSNASPTPHTPGTSASTSNDLDVLDCIQHLFAECLDQWAPWNSVGLVPAWTLSSACELPGFLYTLLILVLVLFIFDCI